MKSLVILTDGTEFPPVRNEETVRQELGSVVDPDNPVRVIITATGKAKCQSLREITRRFDGECFPARTDGELRHAREEIIELLRKPIE